MSTDLFVSIDQVKEWAPAQSDENDDVLAALAEAASSYIARRTRRRVAPTAAEVETHDGDSRRVRGRSREILYLDWNPILVPSTLTVTENGTALVVAQGYSTTADVILKPDEGVLVRRPTFQSSGPVPSRNRSTGWAAGVQNLVVTYRGGYDSTALPAAKDSIPSDLVLVGREIVQTFFRESRRGGRTTVNRAGQSTNFDRDLTPMATRILDQYVRHGPFA